ncbi:MAG: DUF721 domain-containing protein [Spirochaetaceae bacterium]|jgi:hypothetical protein|nr:DUF721 domain-containing protein [Spirochaetaceae bacterium]
MKRAGDIMDAFFDEATIQKAKEYGTLFASASWAALLENCGLSQGIPHSQIADLERAVLLIEADHPGWIQIFQTKQKELLNAARRRFPELGLAGISFRLARGPLFKTGGKPEGSAETEIPPGQDPQNIVEGPVEETEKPAEPGISRQHVNIDAIQDEKLRTALKKLERSIRDRSTEKRTV